MTKKQLYETPEAEVLVVKIEQGFLTASDPNSVRSNSASSGYDSENDLGEI